MLASSWLEEQAWEFDPPFAAPVRCRLSGGTEQRACFSVFKAVVYSAPFLLITRVWLELGEERGIFLPLQSWCEVTQVLSRSEKHEVHGH